MSTSPEPFGALLRRLRARRGWSQTRLAEALAEHTGRATVTRGEVARWERGRRTPRFWLPHLAEVLDVPRADLEVATAAPASADPVATLATLLPPGDSLTPLTATGGRRLGRTAAEGVAARVHALRLADDLLAGGDLIGPARRELNAALRLHREGTHTAEVGRALLGGIGELAQLTGWVLSDAGRHAEAEDAYRLGLSAAREAGDTALAGHLAGSLAYQWSNNGREEDGVELAAAALAETGTAAHPSARALGLDRLAWAHAKNGDHQAAMRALAGAHDALAKEHPDAAPMWSYWVSPAELDVMDARVYTELRRPLRAVPLLREVLGRYDATHTRELALYLSWLAVAYADAGEPEAAAEVAGRMLALAAEVASDRTAGRSRVVLARLAAYSDVPEVRTVLER